MRAVVFDGPGRRLRVQTRAIPTPGPGQLLLKVAACGVCRTDLHLLDGEIAVEHPPRILGHQIVGTVVEHGPGTSGDDLPATGTPSESAHVEEASSRDTPATGTTPSESTHVEDASSRDAPATGTTPSESAHVGVPWLGWTCGECEWCTSGRENLCPNARFTGCDLDGGMAEYAVADARYCFPIPDGYSDEQAAPLLCAGLIGHRCLRMCADAERVGLYGFGAAAHIVAQVANWQRRRVLAFTRPGDTATQSFALELGAVWAGGSDEQPPEALDAAIVFAPDGALVPTALRALRPGGTVVCGGIHMSDIPRFPYELLWQERCVRSVANLTRRDAETFLALAPVVPVRTSVSVYPLERAEQALEDLRGGRFTGAAVVVP